MIRIKIRDLPKDEKITRKEMENLFGGKLTIGQLDDPYEKEADQIADTIVRMEFNAK